MHCEVEVRCDVPAEGCECGSACWLREAKSEPTL